MGGDRGHPRFPGARKWLATSARKCGMRNSERGMGKEKWQMTNAGWRMADGKCRDGTGQPRFLCARKWMAPSARKCGMGNGKMTDGKRQMADGKKQMTDGKWQKADGGWRMADGRRTTADDGCEVRSSGRRDEQSGETTVTSGTRI